jgi:hypothetical protein
MKADMDIEVECELRDLFNSLEHILMEKDLNTQREWLTAIVWCLYRQLGTKPNWLRRSKT